MAFSLTHPILSLEKTEPVTREVPEAGIAARPGPCWAQPVRRFAPEQPWPCAAPLGSGAAVAQQVCVAAGEPSALISYQKSRRVPGKLVLDMAAVGKLKMYHILQYFQLAEVKTSSTIFLTIYQYNFLIQSILELPLNARYFHLNCDSKGQS